MVSNVKVLTLVTTFKSSEIRRWKTDEWLGICIGSRALGTRVLNISFEFSSE
jgi:hypothetical protein